MKKAYVEMECTLTMEIYIVKYTGLLCRYFVSSFDQDNINTHHTPSMANGRAHRKVLSVISHNIAHLNVLPNMC